MELQHINEQKNLIELPNVWRVTCHTDYVGQGSTFVAIQGMHSDGALFIPDAINKGAATIVVAQDVQLSVEVQELIKKHNVLLRRVDNTRKALATLAAQAYDYPAQQLKIIGITGTKGKTTTAYLIHHILRCSGQRAALISSVENRIDEAIFVAHLTTPQPDYLHMFMFLCVQHGITHLVMEVAAQAFTMHRVEGILFDVGVFTNFSHEHLEFYETLDDYFKAKVQLLEHLKSDALLVVNADDSYCLRLIGKHARMRAFQLSDIQEASFVPYISGVYDDQLMYVPELMGSFNASNMLAAINVVKGSDDMPLTFIAQALKSFRGIKGRLQKHRLPNGALCYIDYAHTPNSYREVLSLLRSLTHKLIVVFGCGGGKDKFKRPMMGSIASQYADHIVLTADNPRFEELFDINAQIMVGIDRKDKVYIEDDRARAIEYAYRLSEKEAIVAILGKGPDEFQIVGNKKSFFSDTQTINVFCREGII